jgi:acetyltransferase-like isoleucine patch superfamily enzyme
MQINETVVPSPCAEHTKKITMSKQFLMLALKSACYAPHPEVRKGSLFLSNNIHSEIDRETNVNISPKARLDLTGDITIESWVMIGEDAVLLTHDHYHVGREKPLLKLQEEKGIKWFPKKIGRDVWLHRCIVLPQVTEIPDGVVVGAGSVLTKIPGSYEIWAGNPARKVGER